MFVRKQRNNQGFSLVELAVVVIIIGVLAAFGVPRFRDSVERSKASEAFGYLSSVRSGQERYLAQKGTYADNVSKLDVELPAPKYFDNGAGVVTAAGTGTIQEGWTMTLTRTGASAGYGEYTVTFTKAGYDGSTGVDCIGSTARASINPMGS